MTTIIAPSILAADFAQLGAQLAAADQAGAQWVHIDVMDGHFVPNLTMGPAVVEACRRATSRFLDVHLMIENPERFIDAFANAGADGITIHQETCPDISLVLNQIKQAGCRSGLAINPDTPFSAAEPYLADLDLFLVMSVHPGFGGQKFIEGVLGKVTQARAWADANARPLHVELDGGISAVTAGPSVQAGADVLVAGSAIFGHPDGIAAGIDAMRKSVQ
jgi:ribulose-phosphate 3-epimerase